MRAKAYPLLEQTIEDWLRGYLLNRVNKYVKRVTWYQQTNTNGAGHELREDKDVGRHVREIAEEAADHIMTGICEAFTFTDDEAVIPNEEEIVLAVASNHDCPPAPGVEKIIEFLGQEKARLHSLLNDSVDNLDWIRASEAESIENYIEFILRRIKAEDFPPLHEDS